MDDQKDDHIYEMTENEVYSVVHHQQHQPDAAKTRNESGFLWKFCCRLTVTLIALNFILVIGTSTVLFYYQSKMSSEINQLRTGNLSGLPGTS